MHARFHRRLNNILTILVLAGSLYLIVIPVWPKITWLFKDKSVSAPYEGRLHSAVSGENHDNPVKPTPKDNRIVIPSALIDEPIYTGSNIWVIENGGSWLKNLNVTSPKEQGNTVIVGHRFTYRDPEGAFYNLDKVSVGDLLAVYWGGEELLYTVTETKVVPATALEIESNTSDRQLTLYTCTPLVTAQNRLVIIAKPTEENKL